MQYYKVFRWRSSQLARDDMASLIHEIENNESLLLMFLSGELPPEDHADVQQMLAGDAGLRAELSRLQASYDFAMDSLTRLDADRAAAAGESHAIRQARRAMKQWQVDRLNRQPMQAPAARRHIPAWVYPSAVAAMLLIGTLTYWGIVSDQAGQGIAGIGTASGTGGGSGGGSGLAKIDGSGQRSGEDDSNTVIARANMLESALHRADIPAGIEGAESQADTLVARSGTDSVNSSIFWIDSDQ